MMSNGPTNPQVRLSIEEKRFADAVLQRLDLPPVAHPVTAASCVTPMKPPTAPPLFLSVAPTSLSSACAKRPKHAKGRGKGTAGGAVWIDIPPAGKLMQAQQVRWLAHEDQLILEGVRKHSFKWVKLAPSLPGRSPSSIRNRYIRLTAPEHTEAGSPGCASAMSTSDESVAEALQALEQDANASQVLSMAGPVDARLDRFDTQIAASDAETPCISPDMPLPVSPPLSPPGWYQLRARLECMRLPTRCGRSASKRGRAARAQHTPLGLSHRASAPLQQRFTPSGGEDNGLRKAAMALLHQHRVEIGLAVLSVLFVAPSKIMATPGFKLGFAAVVLWLPMLFLMGSRIANRLTLAGMLCSNASFLVAAVVSPVAELSIQMQRFKEQPSCVTLLTCIAGV